MPLWWSLAFWGLGIFSDVSYSQVLFLKKQEEEGCGEGSEMLGSVPVSQAPVLSTVLGGRGGQRQCQLLKLSG